MDGYLDSQKLDTYPDALLLTLNKARTVSWRSGVAWTLVGSSGEVLICNGKLFYKHSQSLIEDLLTFGNSKKAYISYCPLHSDHDSSLLLQTLRLSELVELNVFAKHVENAAVLNLSGNVSIPTVRWHSYEVNTTQHTGISWVRENHRPWVHVVCSRSLGGGEYPFDKMSKQLGVTPYVVLKGLESSLVCIQSGCSDALGTHLNMINPRFFETCTKLMQYLKSLSSNTASVVTVICDPSWLAILIQMRLANEVSFFLTLLSANGITGTWPEFVEFPENDQWIINSSEIMGEFIRIVLQKG